MQYLSNLNLTSKSLIHCQPCDCNESEELTISVTTKEVRKVSQKLKILVVEDEAINQTVASMFLKQQGYNFDIAKSGEEALALIAKNDYSAILMDVGLPGIDGLETTRQIRALEQGSNRHIPIIACTANGLEYRQKCIDAGMDDFSVKPFEFSALSLILKGWVRS